MSFRGQANIDPNQHKGLIISNSITNATLVATGLSLTNAQPLHVAVVDSSGSQITSFGATANKSNNGGVPGSNNLGVLPAIANAASPSYTEGNQVLLSTDLAGNLRVTGSLSVGGTTDNSAFTAGTSTGTPAMGFYHSTIDTVTDGRSAVFGMTSKRAMLVNLQNASGTEIGTSTNPVRNQSVTTEQVDSNNTSSTPLAGNASFTGTGTSLLGFEYVQVYVFADQSSATNGVKLEFSSDNTNWNDASTFSFTSGGSAPNDGQAYGAPARAQYFRIVYTNGSSAQGTFRLQTVLKTSPSIGDLVTMTTVPNSSNHATLTKSSIVGLTTAGGGGYVDVKVNPSGTLTVDGGSATGSAPPANAYYIGMNDGTNLRGLTTNSTTYTSKFAADANLLGTLGTAFSTAGKVDIKGADGDVFVRQTTASNLNATIVGNQTPADAFANPTNAVNTFGLNAVFNGTTWDRAKSVQGLADSVAGVGLPAAGNYVYNGATWEKMRGDLGDASGATGLLVNNPLLYNGATYDRARGDTTNGLWVNVKNSATITVTATNLSTNLAQVNGATTLAGNGTSGTGAQRVTIASDSTGQVAPAANATATGATFSYTAALSSTKTAIDASAGNLYGYHIYNPNSVVIYIQCFNLASASVTVGSTTPSFVIVVPAGGWADSSYPVPITFSTALTVAATTTASGSGAPTTGLTANFWYK